MLSLAENRLSTRVRLLLIFMIAIKSDLILLVLY